jgi:hypothetical protein
MAAAQSGLRYEIGLLRVQAGVLMNVRKGFARLARVTAITYGVIALLMLGSTLVGALQDEGAGKNQFRVVLGERGEVLRACGPLRFGDDEALCDRRARLEGDSRTFIFPYTATDEEISIAFRYWVLDEDRPAVMREAAEVGERLLVPVERGGNEFRSIAVADIRQELPGAYDDLSDTELTQRLRLQYSEMPAPDFAFAVRGNESELRLQRHLFVWADDGRSAIEVARTYCSRATASCEQAQGELTPVTTRERLMHVWNQLWQPALWWLGIYLALWAIFRAVRYVALGFMDKRDVASAVGHQ